MAMRIFNADETIFTSNGLKSLQPIYCHEIRNESEWYLDVRVPLSFSEYTTQDNIIVVETLDKGEQAFRIRNITVGQDIKFEAWHIGYDSRVFTVALSTFVNLNPTQALTQLLTGTQTNNFTVFSNIATQLSFSIIDVPLYDALIDMTKRYNAVLEFDNWQIRLVSSIGSDKGVTVAYGKNLESSSFEENWDMVVTELYPKGNNGLVGTTVFSSIRYDRPYAKIVSFDTDDLTTLNNLASAYLSRFEKPRVNYKVKASNLSYLENVTGHNALSYFSHLFLENYNHNELSDFKYPTLVGLGDTIKVVAKQFELFTDVLSYKFNVITRKIIELEFGNYRPTIRNAIGQLRAEVVEQSRNITQLKIDEVNGEISAIATDVGTVSAVANSKARTFLSTPTTPYYVGDIWIETDATTGGNRVCTTQRLTGAYVASDWTKEGVTSRMDSAELKITPTAITSTVRSSTEYTNDLGAKVSTNEVISRINQTAEAIKIQAGKISLEGLVTVNSRFKILADGSMEATNGIFSGNITADSGAIADFSLIDNYATVVAGTSGKAITAGSGSNRVGMSPGVTSGGFVYSFWAGNDNPLNAPFRVLRNGGLRSTDAIIAGWTMSGSTISRGNVSLDASSGDGRINIGGSVLFSNSANRLSLTGALDVSGVVTAGQVGSSLIPTTNNLHVLGNSPFRWQTVWISTSAINGSDRRLKEEIKEIEFANDFILNIKPVQFKLIDGQSGRKHYGFIAQEVKETMTKVGIDDFGGYIDPNTNKGEDEDEQMLGLRYEEFIAPMVATIQSQQKKIDELEERLAKLEEILKGVQV